MGARRINGEATKKLQVELEAARDQLASGIGLALAHWSTAEHTLTFIFVSVMDRTRKPVPPGLIPWDQENPQRRMYHTAINAVRGFDPRLDMIGAIIEESDLSARLKRIWPAIATRLKKCYKSRNEIAHFMFEQRGQRDGSYTTLVAPFPTSVIDLTDKRLTRKDLDQKADHYKEINDALVWFMDAVEVQRKRRKEPRGPAPALIQRVRQALKNPSQKSSPKQPHLPRA